MLINTVILFIKDILPVFVLFCFIYIYIKPAWLNKKSTTWLIVTCILGAVIVYCNIEPISDAFDGDGLEIYSVIINVYIYAGLLLSSSKLITTEPLSKLQSYLLLTGAGIFSVMKLSEFFLFFTTSVIHQQTLDHTLVGSIIGIGICSSFSILLAALLTLALTQSTWLKHSFWLLYLNGFLIEILYQLQQIDIISTSSALWNTSGMISGASEYGYLLNTLFGYVASPTVEHLATYAVSLILYLLMLVYWFSTLNKRYRNPLLGGAQ